MIPAWLYRSLKSLLSNPKDYYPSNFGTELQVLSYNDTDTSILLHDGEYLISGVLSSTAKQDLIRSKPSPSQDINRAFVLLNNFYFSKANIVNNNGSYDDNFLIFIFKLSVIKWDCEEILSEEPRSLMSNPELATAIKGLAYGPIGIPFSSLPYAPFFIPYSITSEEDSIANTKSEKDKESSKEDTQPKEAESGVSLCIVEDSEAFVPGNQKSMPDTLTTLTLQTQPMDQVSSSDIIPLKQPVDSLDDENDIPVPFTQRSELPLQSRIKKVKHRAAQKLTVIGFADFSNKCEWRCRWK